MRVNTAEVTAPNFLRRSENTFVRGVVLVVKKFDKPLQLFRPQNTKLKRGPLDTNYDRLIIVGEINRKECFAIIAESAQKSSHLFGDRMLTIGAVVDVREPIFSGQCLGNDRSNPILQVSLPVQVAQDEVTLQPIPIDTHPSSTAMFDFCLPNRSLMFLQAMAVAPTCSGFLCDRKMKKSGSNCACLQKSAVSAWVLSARIVSRDLNNEDEDPLSGEPVQSLAVTKLFCHEAIIRSPHVSIDRERLRCAVRNVNNHVNGNGGWQVSGFYKSGSTEENVAQYVQHVRSCRVKPAVEILNDLKYNVVPCNDNNNGNAPPPFAARKCERGRCRQQEQHSLKEKLSQFKALDRMVLATVCVEIDSCETLKSFQSGYS